VTWLAERLADMRRHLEHLRALRPRVTDATLLETDLSLRTSCAGSGIRDPAEALPVRE
jgi:hypothetical protein